MTIEASSLSDGLRDCQPNSETQERIDPQEFFEQVFDELDNIAWEDPEKDRGLETVAQEIGETVQRVNNFYRHLTPDDIYKNREFWLACMTEERKMAAYSLLIHLRAQDGGKKPLELWNQALNYIQEGLFETSFCLFFEHRQSIDHQALSLARKYRDRMVKNGVGEDILTHLPLFLPLRERWRQRFEKLTDPREQTKYIQFIYGVENCFLTETPLIRILINELFDEWQQSEFNQPGLSQEKLEMIKGKISKGLTEMGLASVSAKSAWAYVGQELPRDFIKYLLRTDARHKALQLMNDLVGLAQRGQFLYPPQLFYIFHFLLPEDLRVNSDRTLIQTLDQLYDSGACLLDCSPRLNFIVTGDQRSKEYISFIHGFLEGCDKQGVAFFPFSGPPNDTLLRWLGWKWQGPLWTCDSAGREELLSRALALPNELEANQQPYAPAELEERIIELAERANAINPQAYPISNNTWPHHLRAQLPNREIVKIMTEKGQPTMIVDQRGSNLYGSSKKSVVIVPLDFL